MKLILLVSLIRFIVCRQYHVSPSSCEHHLQEPCVTLNQFTAITSKYLDSNTTLILYPGNHSLDYLLSASNVTNFVIFPEYILSKTVTSVVIITCGVTGRLDFTNVNRVHIVGVYFVGCVSNKVSLVESFVVEQSTFLGHEAVGGRLLQIVQSKGTVLRCLFTKVINSTDEDNGALRLTRSDIVVVECVFRDVNSINGALFCEENSTVDILKSSFYNNVYSSHQTELVSVGTLYITTHSMVIIQECLFQGSKTFSLNNYAIAAHNSNSVIIHSSKFRNINNCGVVSAVNVQMLIVNNSVFITNDGYPNEINDSGCELKDGNAPNSQVITERTTVNISYCQFTANTRGVLAASRSIIDVSKSEFINNTKFKHGTVLWAEYSITSIRECEFRNNEAVNMGGAVELRQCRATITNSVFHNNRADFGGGLALFGTAITISGSDFSNNFANYMGGAIYAEAETLHMEITFQDTCLLSNNHAGLDYGSGGGLHLTSGGENRVKTLVQGKLIIANNTVYQGNGGGVFLYLVKLTIQGNGSLELIHNYADISGGGIYAEGSVINVNPHLDPKREFISFLRNHAMYGGGLYMCKGVLYVSMSTCDSTFHHSIKFISNSANIGGAIYLYEICDLFEDMIDHCFFHILPIISNCTQAQFKDFSKHSIHFSQNYAEISGSSVYKESFGYCTMDHLRVQEFTNLLEVSDISVSDIGSLAVQACLCQNGQPDCNYQIHSVVKVINGKEFTVEVAIADRGNHIVNGSISTQIQGGLIREDQRTQDVTGGCTLLKFNIFSTQGYQHLTMMPIVKSPYIYTNLSSTVITIEFPFCISCPTGFQKIVNKVTGCDCNCDKDLKSFVISCNPSTGVITKGRTTAWISYINVTKGTNGYLIYPYCPFDYCLPPDETVDINLNMPNGADTQCAHNRSGTLCGICSEGLSLSLGSSNCIPCPYNWHSSLSAILCGWILAGVILVIFLMLLNLTVAVGTLNGIIFYANIVGANISVFFPSVSIFTVFISWINLELGIDTCLFEEMDTYWKVWVELAFPAYIIILVVVVIITSERFVIVARLVGKKNPVATLDTLILLSYMKFLRIIIASYSFAILNYPDNSYQILWLPDATVHYFSGKHIVLSIIATVILLAGIAYTTLLFFWQWLLLHQRRKIFKWVRHQRLCLFLEPYHAPYNFKHRYWTGLLLFVRVILYVISSVNLSGDPGINILATGVLVSSLLLLKGLLRSNSAIYKKWPLEVLEVISYINIVWFCLASYYTVESERGQWIVSYVSGSITFVLFLIVLAYHVINECFVKTNLYQILKQLLLRERYRIVNNRDDATLTLLACDENVKISEQNLPTHTEIQLSELIQADSDKPKQDDAPSEISHESKKQSENDNVCHHQNTNNSPHHII